MTRIVMSLLVLLTLETAALAGTVTVRDDLKVLTTVEVDHLKKIAESWPFDTRFILDSHLQTAAEVDAAAAAWTDTGNVMVIAWSPTIRYGAASFSQDVGLRPEQFRPVMIPGNERLKQKLYGLGVESVGDRALVLLSSEHPDKYRDRIRGEKIVRDPYPPKVKEGDSNAAIAGAVTLGAALLGGAVALGRRKKKDGENADASPPPSA